MFQIQEIMRAERLVHDRQIQEEIDAYNPLIPDGSNSRTKVGKTWSEDP